jgi:hypothetical protein
MKNTIRITPHITNFHVVEDRGDGKHKILAEFARYDDALAAARLLGRDMGLSVEVQPDGLEGGAR